MQLNITVLCVCPSTASSFRSVTFFGMGKEIELRQRPIAKRLERCLAQRPLRESFSTPLSQILVRLQISSRSQCYWKMNVWRHCDVFKRQIGQFYSDIFECWLEDNRFISLYSVILRMREFLLSKDLRIRDCI